MNMGLDSVISWEGGLYRLGNQFFNRALQILISVRGIIKGWRAYSIKRTIDSIGEIDEDGKYIEIFRPADQ